MSQQLPAFADIASRRTLEDERLDQSQVKVDGGSHFNLLLKAHEVQNMSQSTSPRYVPASSPPQAPEPTPSRKRPFEQLPPINPTAPPQRSYQQSSPSSTTRAASVHDLLNHVASEPPRRDASESPASSHGPPTPGTSLPSVHDLGVPRWSLGGSASEARKMPFTFRATTPPLAPRAVALPRISTTYDNSRRGSTASFLSATSPSSTNMGSFDSSRPSPPPLHAPVPAYNHAMVGHLGFSHGNWGNIPIDVQTASRTADEKRKRNALASNRFRQRVKERRKESAEKIAHLEKKAQDLEEQIQYYRRERDYLRQFAQSHGLTAPPRPASPRQPTTPPASAATTPAAEWSQQGQRGNDEGRNQRRRMDYFDGPPYHQ